MNNNDTQILKQTREIKVGSESITVRELRWGEGLDFINQLANYIESFFGADGTPRLSVNTVKDLITTTEGLANGLLSKSTDKDEAWLKELSIGEAMGLLDIALDLNLSIITEKGKTIASRFQGVGGAGELTMTRLASPKPTPTSSPTATPRNT